MLLKVIPVAIGLSALAGASTANAVDLRTHPVSTLGSVVDIRNAGDGSRRLFLVSRAGRIHIVKDGQQLPQPFLDISGRISSGGERGLLSVAFAPDYAQSGFFYAWYTDPAGDTVLSRFRNSGIPDLADPDSERVLLTVDQPFSNHNGGRLQFGPDGYLYLGLGDGGGGGDPQSNAQNPATLLGKLIRIDVNPVHVEYAIPPDNPFLDDPGVAGEIWAMGLRNPWRISFDAHNGDLYIADVGQGEREEVNVQPAASAGGENYGWNIAEGSLCFQPGCDLAGLTLPVAEYSHAEGCAITGGEVYRGNAYPDLHGRYLYADYCSGVIWSLRWQAGQWQSEQVADTGLSIATFGLGEDGSLYLSSFGDGVFQLSDGPLTAERGFEIGPELNDAWVSPGKPGQGLLVSVFPESRTFFAGWFTYELTRPLSDQAIIGESGHRWLTVQGGWQGWVADLTVYLTRGGVFDSAQPAPEPAVAVGTMRIEFHDCDSATASYVLPGIRSGSFELTRVAKDNLARCETTGSP